MADSATAVCLGVLKAIRRFMKPNVTLRQVLIFLYVAEHEPVTQAEIAKQRGIPPGTVYDDLKALGKRDALGKEGSKLLTELPGGPDSPAFRYTLSPRGKLALEALEFEMASAAFVAAYEDDEPLEEYFAAKRHSRS